MAPLTGIQITLLASQPVEECRAGQSTLRRRLEPNTHFTQLL
jgi:hypothetical protein